MDDSKIVELYWERSESAIIETTKKYSRYCHYISFNILHNNEDAEECVNDTYMRAWNAMPPQRPNYLSAFLGKITRNLSFDKYKKYNAEKRGLGQTELVLSELEDCIPTTSNVEQMTDEMILVKALNAFLVALPKTNRVVFVRRYWHLSAIKEIAKQYGMSESKVKSMLFRIRNELKEYLEKEGITL
ncbi:MAG: RNA polymerase sigma factor [Desulfitobacteriaceae bacterium]|nr:RNA polymerase sigma factor [Desulfitobacteriaceae bacterium]MDD4347014.1 RNA polymerase sigma factor [Desulfitobacteriaceae bacterium]MDD4402198.1 RNA polymerase sigma factor [Desulfitobacteriaceae bacterium]